MSLLFYEHCSFFLWALCTIGILRALSAKALGWSNLLCLLAVLEFTAQASPTHHRKTWSLFIFSWDLAERGKPQGSAEELSLRCICFTFFFRDRLSDLFSVSDSTVVLLLSASGDGKVGSKIWHLCKVKTSLVVSVQENKTSNRTPHLSAVSVVAGVLTGCIMEYVTGCLIVGYWAQPSSVS